MQIGTLQPARRGLSADVLKMIAIFAMLIDHSAYLFTADYYSPLGTVMHCIGRITGPTMFFFLAEGYHHTQNKNRYTLRLFLFACVSYLPFIYFRTGGLPTQQSAWQLNVIYTLLLAHLALRARHEIRRVPVKVLAIAGLLLLSVFGDWGYFAVLCTLLFDLLRGDFRKQAVGYCLLALTRIMPPVNDVVQMWVAGAPPERFAYYGQIIVLCGMFLPILLLHFYNGQKGNLSQVGKWMFYAFYPAHLLLLGWLRWGLV